MAKRGGRTPTGGDGPPRRVSSWERSARDVSWEVRAAPLSTSDDVAEQWAQSRLGRASRVILDDLRDLAREGDLMAAITDETVTIAWVAGGPTMARRAERVNFSLGGVLGRGRGGHQRAGPGLRHRPARHGVLRRALRTGRRDHRRWC